MTPTDVVDSAFGQDQYDRTIGELEAGGYKLGQTLFTYPYDWRRSVGSAAAGLQAKIDAVRSATGASRVDILAHSQGGLVTRVALLDAATAGKVRRVLTIATPYYGAAKFLAILLTGKPCIPKQSRSSRSAIGHSVTARPTAVM